MKRVELYGRVRHAVMIEGLSQREAARCFGIDPRTVRKILSYSVPPGYVRTRPPVRPKLDPFIGIIDRILEEDKDRPKKQRHTSKRIFERLRDEYGFTGKITIVKDPAAIMSTRAVLPEPRPPMTAVSPAFNSKTGVLIQAASSTRTSSMICEAAVHAGGEDPTYARSGTRHAWRSVSNEASPFIQQNRSSAGLPTRPSSCASLPHRQGLRPRYLSFSSAGLAAPFPSQKSLCFKLDANIA